jgi:hypothetical protein
VREEIVRVKHLVYCSSEPVIQTGAIDTLATYGEQAIDAITEVISLYNISDQVRDYGREAIEGINGQN